MANKLSSAARRLKRALRLEPKHCGGATWYTQSATFPGVIYTQTVHAPRSLREHGLAALDYSCTCPATAECKHIVAVRRRVEANCQYVFALFGLPAGARWQQVFDAQRTGLFKGAARAASPSTVGGISQFHGAKQ